MYVNEHDEGPVLGASESEKSAESISHHQYAPPGDQGRAEAAPSETEDSPVEVPVKGGSDPTSSPNDEKQPYAATKLMKVAEKYIVDVRPCGWCGSSHGRRRQVTSSGRSIQ